MRTPAGWTLLAGDAYFYHREMDAERPWCTPGLRMYQTLMEKDRQARLGNQQRLRQLKSQFGHEIEILSAHDPVEFERASGRPAGEPPTGAFSSARAQAAMQQSDQLSHG